MFAQLTAEAQSNQGLAAQFHDHYFGPRRRQAFALLEAAQGGGQIRRDADLATIVDHIWGACYIRLLLPYLSDQFTPESPTGWSNSRWSESP